MATTTNYSWTTPDDTALVKDGAAAIRSLGTAIDTTVFNNASAAIAKTIVDAKGDIIAATAADTVARLAVGANNTVLTADSSTATGLKWAAVASGGMTLISTTSLSGNAIALTSIPQTYNDLRIVISGASNGTGEDDITCLRFNNNSTANIYRRIATGVEDGTATSQANQGAQVRLSIQSINAGTTNSLLVIDVPNYTSSTTNKVGFCLNSYTTGVTSTKRSEEVAFSFDDTTAITRIDLLTLNAYNWDNGTVYLYGVK